MDRATIEQMPAGRELDTLVAEKVLRWKRQERGRSSSLPWPHWISDGTTYLELPRFSEDVGDAWEIVRELIKRGLHVSLDSDGSGWTADFTPNPLVTFFTCADTAPLAICRAALRVVENE